MSTTTRLMCPWLLFVASGATAIAAGSMTIERGMQSAHSALAPAQGVPGTNVTQAKAGSAQAEPAANATDTGRLAAEDEIDILLREYEMAHLMNQRFIESLSGKPIEPSKKVAELKAQSQPFVQMQRRVCERFLELATRDPHTNPAEQALAWLASNPSLRHEPEVEKARDLLARDYARSDRLRRVFAETYPDYSWSSPATERLARRALERNPSREIRAFACYRLAQLLKRRSEHLRIWPISAESKQWDLRTGRIDAETADWLEKGDPNAMEDEALRLFQRTLAEFSTIPNRDVHSDESPFLRLGDSAGYYQDELVRYTVGKPVPEIEGYDLDGKGMRLSDYRGQIVVLFIGGPSPMRILGERAPAAVIGNFRRLAKATPGRPVVFLGVTSAWREEFQKGIRASGLPIRFWWDPNSNSGIGLGMIRTTWHAYEDTYYLIDQKGIIRFRKWLGFDAGEKALATLLKELETEKEPPGTSD